MADANLSALIWSVAELLRGDYRPHEYGRAILRFTAVIANEAHSSQTGEAAPRVGAVLSSAELVAVDDGGEIGTEDMLAAERARRCSHRSASRTGRARSCSTKPRSTRRCGPRSQGWPPLEIRGPIAYTPRPRWGTQVANESRL